MNADCDEELCRARTGEPVRFRDTSSGAVTSRRWEFGDGASSRSASPLHSWTDPGFHEARLLVTDGSREAAASRMFLVEAAEPAGLCASDPSTRCLRDSRFAVAVDWSNVAGESGAASVVHAGPNDSGLFRFFDRSNWEILVKVLDGCDVNGAVWVFTASTTDLGYTIRITDTATDTIREYSNEPGAPAPAVTDVEAFPDACRTD